MSNSPPLLQELPTEQDIGGASGVRRLYVLTYGKENSEQFPYNIPNEKISSELARVAGLPVPEVVLHQHRGQWLFLSRAVETVESGESRPPGTSSDVAKAIANSPGLIEEMVCFDLFVCNNDRNPGNFLCDAEKNVWLIDFGNSLFYRPSGRGQIQAGVSRLKSVEEQLDALFDKPYSFLRECHTWDAMQRSFQRIAAIPEYFIENTINRLPRDLLTESEREFSIDFLNRRKTSMEQIVRDNSRLFPNLEIPVNK